MKRTWFSVLIVVGVLALLTLFLGLQYRWLTEASDAERDRMQKRVETDTTRFAEDFNREMQAAYFNFQTHSDLWKNSAWPEFAERYAFWKGRAEYPNLIRDIYYVSKDPASSPLHYVPDMQTFETSASSDSLNAIRPLFTDEKTFRPVYAEQLAMVVPVFDVDEQVDRIVIRRTADPARNLPQIPPPQERSGFVVVFLDERVVKDELLAGLTQKYFAERDYFVTVLDQDGQPVFSNPHSTDAYDAKKSLFDLSPRNFMFFTNKGELPIPRSGEKGVVIDQRVESHSFTTTRTENLTGKTGKFTIEVNEPRDKVRTSVLATAEDKDGIWTVRAQHSSGSIATFIGSERNKSFLVGLGIYALLVGAIAAIMISAIRSKRFAQRQIDFVSSVSHEFRTPLAVIYSAGENLADGIAKEDEQVSRYGDLIKKEGKKLSGMVEQILEFAGANSGKPKYTLELTEVEEIVDDAIAECQPLIDSSGFTIEREIQRGLPSIRADRGALSTAVQNLIANSVKYSNGAKWIRVSVVNGSKSVKIAVEDRGIGIRDGDLAQIFEPFYRAKEVVDAQISGSGLGLNMVKKIAEAHGGSVRVKSDPGSGSRFTIELPQH